jgi:DNA-binding NtrC family response regulator
MILKALERMLRDRYRVVKCQAAQQVLETVRRERETLELVILDHYLPDGNGLALIPQIRAEVPSVSIGLISGGLTPDLEAAAKRASADWTLLKSFDSAQLLATIRRNDQRKEQTSDAPLQAVAPAPAGFDTDLTLNTAQRRHVQFVLDSVAGNRTQAARLMNIDRATLQRKLRYYSAADAEHPEPRGRRVSEDD